MPASWQRWPKTVLVYCEPWSLWWTRPGAGRVRRIAISSAAVTISVASVSRMAHPTQRRVQASRTQAR